MARTATPTRSENISVGGSGANALMAAWQGIYHLFGGTVESWTITEDGLAAEGFSVALPYNPEQIVSDISHRDRQVPFFPSYNYFNGEEPAPFTDKAQVTQWLTQFMRGSVEEGTARAPAYARDAATSYKVANSLARKKGRPRKIIRLDNLDEVTPDMLEKLTPDALANLANIIEQAKASQAAATVS